jgi:hypothetical protein
MQWCGRGFPRCLFIAAPQLHRVADFGGVGSGVGGFTIDLRGVAGVAPGATIADPPSSRRTAGTPWVRVLTSVLFHDPLGSDLRAETGHMQALSGRSPLGSGRKWAPRHAPAGPRAALMEPRTRPCFPQCCWRPGRTSLRSTSCTAQHSEFCGAVYLHECISLLELTPNLRKKGNVPSCTGCTP